LLDEERGAGGCDIVALKRSTGPANVVMTPPGATCGRNIEGIGNIDIAPLSTAPPSDC